MALSALDVVPRVFKEEAERAHAREFGIILVVLILSEILLLGLVWCVVAGCSRYV